MTEAEQPATASDEPTAPEAVVDAEVEAEENVDPSPTEDTEETPETEDSEEIEEAGISEVDISDAEDAPEEIRRAIEALILVADTPVSVSLLAQLTEVSAATVTKVCQELAAEYEADARGFVLVNIAGGYRFQTHSDLAPYIERFALEGQSSRLSAAALETLAIIAYKQPLSRAQVTAIRGVNADAVIRTLHQRGYIDEIPREDGQGLAVLFRTTDMFLERIGLSDISELPALGEFAPGADLVEALEQSLSAEPVDEELLPAAEAGDADEAPKVQEIESPEIAVDAEESVEDRLDAVVIDLRDSARAERD